MIRLEGAHQQSSFQAGEVKNEPVYLHNLAMQVDLPCMGGYEPRNFWDYTATSQMAEQCPYHVVLVWQGVFRLNQKTCENRVRGFLDPQTPEIHDAAHFDIAAAACSYSIVPSRAMLYPPNYETFFLFLEHGRGIRYNHGASR